MTQDDQKKAAAEAALEYVDYGEVIGVGTGSTANYFIDALSRIKNRLDGVVASSEVSKQRALRQGIPVLELNAVAGLALYVDGADEATHNRHLIKGGGGALVREKIVAASSDKFVCIVDGTKMSDVLGSFPLPIEVIPMARSLVSRRIVGFGGVPEFREGFITDNGNQILDIKRLELTDPIRLETEINSIPGVVDN
ncbi:uncharacterized protein METZ01_LOCUS474319, partial [marine metagenome]